MKIGTMLRMGVICALALSLGAQGRVQAQESWHGSGSALSIPRSALMQPGQLNMMLAATGAEKPLVLQVGSHLLFQEAHISGAEYAGPASQDSGLGELRARVAPLPRSSPIVIYCGCCPWNRCPNIAPAYKLLRDMGFIRLKVLYLANNFGADWVDKGFPVERGE